MCGRYAIGELTSLVLFNYLESIVTTRYALKLVRTENEGSMFLRNVGRLSAYKSQSTQRYSPKTDGRENLTFYLPIHICLYCNVVKVRFNVGAQTVLELGPVLKCKYCPWKLLALLHCN